MSTKKLPLDAFDHYYALGPSRTLAAVAAHFQVAAKTVQRRAQADQWAARVQDRDRQVRAASDKKAVETLADVNERHLKFARAIQRKAIEGMTRLNLDTAMDCIRALDIGLKQERLVLGEPTENTNVNVEAIIKREYERWLVADATSDLDSK
jgi:hypothetical protein